ncbi:MAG: dTDP-4-dehydrorhamnose 3,5-epimerase [Steroidobacteraceae bacterium]
MIFTACAIQGAYIIDLQRREDERGFFARQWCDTELAQRGLVGRIRQVNTGFSRSSGTVRGMHFQRPPHQEVKVVRCVRGAVFDVAVDLRSDSGTYGRWMSVELSAENGRSLYIPEGCAHGYQTLVDDTELVYSTSQPYAADSAGGVRFDDRAFGIVWPRRVTIISEADRNWPDFQPQR